MKKLLFFINSLLLSSFIFACGQGTNEESKMDNTDTMTDQKGGDNGDNTDFVCESANVGFEAKYCEGNIIQNPTPQNGYLQFSAINVPMAFDSYLKREAPASYPYNYILVEIFAEDGENYPIKPGVYELGTSPMEKNVHTCNNCVTMGLDTNKKGNPAKKLLAVRGRVTINSIDEGQLQAKLENAYFKEYTEEFDEDGEPLNAKFVADGTDWCVPEVTFDGTSFHVYTGN